MSDPSPASPFDELPELMISLRSLGSRRRMGVARAGGTDEQDRYFAPLVEARRKAATAADVAQVLEAFDALHLLAMLDTTIGTFAASRFASRPPARRAFEAGLLEIVEPLRRSLERLAERAAPLERGDEDTRRRLWPGWLEALRAAFRVADDCWTPLRDALDAVPPAVSRRGFRLGRSTRGRR
jgi:hypothetical protein